MNLFLTKNLAHYNSDCLYKFYVYKIDVYDVSMYGFFKGGILFMTFLFRNSKKNKNELWHFADQNTDTHPPQTHTHTHTQIYIYIYMYKYIYIYTYIHTYFYTYF